VVVGSLVLILVAIGLLVAGLVQGANGMLVASIAASLLAAVALIIGGRRTAGAALRENGRAPLEHTRSRASAAADDVEPDEVGRRSRRREPVGAGVGAGVAAGGAAGGSSAARLDETTTMSALRDEEYPGERGIPQQGRDSGRRRYEEDYGPEFAVDVPDDGDDDDPPDEPPAQQTAAADAARIARMSAPVIVIDGRPRYHKPGCVHLLGRDSEPLPVSEAVELGFTPCGVCEPDSTLLAAARRV
jgi:hypothetical protein